MLTHAEELSTPKGPVSLDEVLPDDAHFCDRRAAYNGEASAVAWTRASGRLAGHGANR
jgi:hypothetical protein